MHGEWGRHRETMSAVAASAAQVAGRAMESAASAVEAANRKLDDARDKQARRRDPKAVHLRSLEGARRNTVGWVSSAGTTAAVSAAGFVAAAPEVGLGFTGVTAVLVVPAVVAGRRLRELRRKPVPPRGYARRQLPRPTSATYGRIKRLVDAEQEFLALVAVLARAHALPPAVVTELDDDADESAAAIVGYAQQLQDLEAVTGRSRDPVLRRCVDDGLSRLDEGVAAYQDMVRSAAATVAAAHGSAIARPGAGYDELGRATPRLRDSAERLQAWAEGIAALPAVPDPRVW